VPVIDRMDAAGLRARRFVGALAVLVCCLAGFAAGRADDARPPIHAVQLDLVGPIGPASADYVVRNLARAEAEAAAFVVLRIDTPGGLDTSMREIVRAILASRVPVIGFVGPSGAHAASAGTFILYACHVAAMAPGTNLGAATPVQIGGPGTPSGAPEPDKTEDGGDGTSRPARKPDIRDKAVSDAVAYLRSLAQMRGRNVEFAEKAVLEAASLSADDALAAGVIEIVAADVAALLDRLDGREVAIDGEIRRLATAGVRITDVEPDWRTRLLAVITDPNVASILMLIGIYGLILEFYSPGLVGPGVVGAICLLLALYAFHVLPIDYSGLALILLGIALIVAEAFVPSFGVLGLGGIVAFVIGSVMLFDRDIPGFAVAWPLVGGVALAGGASLVLITTLVLRARRRPVVSGREQMVGSSGRVLAWSGDRGRVLVHGEVWQARAAAPLAAGRTVKVARVDGLTLDVIPNE
jgi:membrane-bound serine protease (ClpP class)